MALPGHREPSVFDRIDPREWVIQAVPQARNGLPEHAPYAWSPPDPAEAERDQWAWQKVAEAQARLRGEPPPAPVSEPWDLRPCAGCGFQMRCACGEDR